MGAGFAICAAIAAAFLVQAVLFRAGMLRFLGRWYFEPYAPLPVRHLPFMAVPVATFASVAAFMFLLAGSEGVVGGVVGVTAAISVLLGALAGSVAVALFPPTWLKPVWMREEETSQLAAALAAERAAMTPLDHPGERPATESALADPAPFEPEHDQPERARDQA